VKLYFEKQQEPSLQAEEREVVYAADLAEQIRTVVEELIKGSTAAACRRSRPRRRSTECS
jgi:hypothetical protein